MRPTCPANVDPDQVAARLPSLEALQLVAHEPAAVRHVRVFGATAELAWIPSRAARAGQPGPDRPAFRGDAAERILAGETLHREGPFTVTPNRYPFAPQLALLWAEPAQREASVELLGTAFAWAWRHGGTALLNSIGAASSIPRAHVHVTPEQLPFLDQLDEEPLAAEWLPRTDSVVFVRKRIPCWFVGVRGAAADVARAVHALQLRRSSASFTLVARDRTAWLVPRTLETAPGFPHPLGSAEAWGRWCYLREEDFARAEPAQLEQALVASGMRCAAGSTA
ncbi:MAG: hypothetical protein RIT25_1923 [Planctomycetota bacterium]